MKRPRIEESQKIFICNLTRYRGRKMIFFPSRLTALVISDWILSSIFYRYPPLVGGVLFCFVLLLLFGKAILFSRHASESCLLVEFLHSNLTFFSLFLRFTLLPNFVYIFFFTFILYTLFFLHPLSTTIEWEFFFSVWKALSHRSTPTTNESWNVTTGRTVLRGNNTNGRSKTRTQEHYSQMTLLWLGMETHHYHSPGSIAADRGQSSQGRVS